MFLLLAVLLLVFLPDPWNLAAALASAVLGGIEVLFWERRMRRQRVRTGVEDLVGATGEVTQVLAPSGQIKLRGELWEAHSATPLKPGARVRVLSVDDLTLEVAPAENGSAGAARAAGALLAMAALLVLAGCGGDDDESSAEAYANDVCSSMSEWVTDVQASVDTLREAGLSTSREDLTSAVDNVENSTQSLVDDFERLGAPDTENGTQAQEELQKLGSELTRGVETVQNAVASGASVASIATTVSTAISQALTAAQATYQELQSSAGELRDAFEDSDDCKSLREELDEVRS